MRMGRAITAAAAALLVASLALMPIQDGFAKERKLPGTSLADLALQRDVAGAIARVEMILGHGCKKSRIVNTEVIEAPTTLNVDPWVERWTVDRCGTPVEYRVELTPSKGGGTDFDVGTEYRAPAAEDQPSPPAIEPAPSEPPSSETLAPTPPPQQPS